jgi:hypothetical protein
MAAAADSARQLAPHYYRDNFLALCDTVEAQYGDLLNAGEQALLASYRDLPFDAQCLYVRLVSRVGPWFRESRLCYPELGAIPPIVDQLLAAGLAEEADGLWPEEIAGLYTLPELRQVFTPRLPAPAPRAKSSLLEAITALELEPDELLALLSGIDAQRVIAPGGLEEVARLQLLFFGNRRQSLTEFVLSDLGVARYYPYELDRQHRLFAERAALEEYLECATLGDAWYELRDRGEWEALPDLVASLLACEIRYPSSEKRWHRLCNGVARDLERLDEAELAALLYQRSARHPARERRLRILERAGDWRGALRLGEQILADPWCEEEQDAARRVLPRVRRQLGVKSPPRPRDDFPRLDLTLERGEQSVELLAAQHLEPDWAAVHYVENSLMNALFGLAFWEQIFMPIPGAFHNPFQSAPTDMYSPEFRNRRQRELASRLRDLRQHGAGRLLLQAWADYQPFQCQWVDWRCLERVDLAQVLRIIPDRHLLAVWERILFDPGENRRGFPDLLALGDRPGEYCLIEVKGPGDALQESQKRWLRFFRREQIPAAVAWVAWREEPVA